MQHHYAEIDPTNFDHTSLRQEPFFFSDHRMIWAIMHLKANQFSISDMLTFIARQKYNCILRIDTVCVIECVYCIRGYIQMYG